MNANPWPARLAPWLALLVTACGSDPAAVDLNPKSISLSRKGEAKTLAPTVLDDENKPIEGSAIEWSSGDPKIATVDGQGKVSAVSTGTTTIAAKVKGTDIENKVVVSVIIPARIEPDPASVLLRGPGLKQDVLLRVFDDKGQLIAGQRADWTSDNEAVATAANGTITAVADGSCKIVVTASDATAQIPVLVKSPVPTTVTIDPDKVVVKIGHSQQLGVQVHDDIGNPMSSFKAVWAAADPSIATVSETGLITGVRRGNTFVSATVGEAVAQVPVGVR